MGLEEAVRDMDLIIMAAPRAVPNWHSTLASAVLGGWSGPTTIMLDSYDLSNPEMELYDHHGVKIVLLTRAEEEAQKTRLPKHRALHNAIRCLRAVKPNSFAVIVEDDLTFARLWEGVIIRQILANYVSPTSVVLGYSREKIESRHSLVENAHDWDCTVFVAWHGALAHQAADVLEKNLALGGDALPADNALTCFWKANKIRRYTMVPSIVQHLGDTALINPKDGIRRTPMWAHK